MACSSYRTLLVCASGAVWTSDARPEGKDTKPVLMESLRNIQKVACGLFHSVALSVDGDVYMWTEEKEPRLIDFFYGRAVCDVAAGQTRTYAVTEGGEVYLWDRDPVGGMEKAPELVRELQSVPVVRIACGDGFTMALSVNWLGETKVYSWGNNNYGQLGRKTPVLLSGQVARDDVPAPVELDGVFNDISCGGFHAVVTGGRYIGARSSIATDLLSALQSRYLSDFTFVLSAGIAIQAHALLIAARLPTYVTSLGAQWASGKAVVPESVCTEPADFAAVLSYLYGGRIAMTQLSACKYLSIAAYLCCPTLFKLCKDRVRPSAAALQELLASLSPPAAAALQKDPAALHLSVSLPILTDFSDVAFVIDGAARRAHRWVVAARCPYFRALWTSGMKEASQAELPLSVRMPVFDAVLAYIYTEDCNGITEDTCFEILALASEWQLDRLRLACETYMIGGLDAENAVSMLRHADLYSAARLRKAALVMARQHRAEAQAAEDWAVLPAPLQAQILSK